MKPVRVMYVFHFNGACLGGAAQSLLDMLAGLDGRVRPCLVIGEDAKIDDILEERGIKFYKICLSNDTVCIGSHSRAEEERDICLSYQSAVKLVEIIRKEEIELIHINSSIGKAGAAAALMTHIPYVWHIREVMEEQFNREFVNADLKQGLLDSADRLITISDFVQKIYADKYHMESERVYNGFDVGRYKRNIASGRTYHNTFLAAALISPGKGQWDAIRAVQILLGEGYTDIRLVIAGHGDAAYIWALKKYIAREGLEKFVQIVPYQRDLSKLRQKASYAITCSQNEALGRVTVESMLAGNIVIGADSGGTAEIIGEHEERGFLYELNNVQSLAGAIVRAIRLPSAEKDRLARSAQEYAEKTFGLEQYCENIMRIYGSVLGKPGKAPDSSLVGALERRYRLIGVTDVLQEYGENTNQNQYKKVSAINALLFKWLEAKQKNISMEMYFKAEHISRIAIYGMGDLGRRLYDELENSEIRITHILDRNPGNMGSILDFSSVDGQEMETDAVIVTVVFAESIVRKLRGKGYERVITLAEILDELGSMANGTEEVFLYNR